MKYSTVTIIALAGIGNAMPLAQFSLPSFGLPSFPKPTGGSSLGDFSMPSFGGQPAATSAPSVGGTPPTGVQQSAAAPSQTGSTGGGSVGSNCTPQGSGGGSTENGVSDKNCCTDVTVVFARGTGEFGNMGTIAGPPMVKSLREKLGAERVLVQGVDYAASAAVSIRSPLSSIMR